MYCYNTNKRASKRCNAARSSYTPSLEAPGSPGLMNFEFDEDMLALLNSVTQPTQKGVETDGSVSTQMIVEPDIELNHSSSVEDMLAILNSDTQRAQQADLKTDGSVSSEMIWEANIELNPSSSAEAMFALLNSDTQPTPQGPSETDGSVSSEMNWEQEFYALWNGMISNSGDLRPLPVNMATNIETSPTTGVVEPCKTFYPNAGPPNRMNHVRPRGALWNSNTDFSVGDNGMMSNSDDLAPLPVNMATNNETSPTAGLVEFCNTFYPSAGPPNMTNHASPTLSVSPQDHYSVLSTPTTQSTSIVISPKHFDFDGTGLNLPLNSEKVWEVKVGGLDDDGKKVHLTISESQEVREWPADTKHRIIWVAEVVGVSNVGLIQRSKVEITKKSELWNAFCVANNNWNVEKLLDSDITFGQDAVSVRDREQNVLYRIIVKLLAAHYVGDDSQKDNVVELVLAKLEVIARALIQVRWHWFKVARKTLKDKLKKKLAEFRREELGLRVISRKSRLSVQQVMEIIEKEFVNAKTEYDKYNTYMDHAAHWFDGSKNVKQKFCKELLGQLKQVEPSLKFLYIKPDKVEAFDRTMENKMMAKLAKIRSEVVLSPLVTSAISASDVDEVRARVDQAIRAAESALNSE